MALQDIHKTIGGGALALACCTATHFEGTRLKAYLDPVGIPTICMGETQGVALGMVKSQQQCDAMLKATMTKHLAYVDSRLKRKEPAPRRAALASFAYNVGDGRFAKSSVLTLINQGKPIEGCNALLKYVYAGGVQLPGLVRRRTAEKDLCLAED